MLIERKRNAIVAQVTQSFILTMFPEDRKLLPNELFISLVRDYLDRFHGWKTVKYL